MQGAGTLTKYNVKPIWFVSVLLVPAWPRVALGVGVLGVPRAFRPAHKHSALFLYPKLAPCILHPMGSYPKWATRVFARCVFLHPKWAPLALHPKDLYPKWAPCVFVPKLGAACLCTQGGRRTFCTFETKGIEVRSWGTPPPQFLPK